MVLSTLYRLKGMLSRLSFIRILSYVCFAQLFDFSREVRPILEVLVSKTLEQSLIEVMEEEELAALRSQQRAFEELRNAEAVEKASVRCSIVMVVQFPIPKPTSTLILSIPLLVCRRASRNRSGGTARRRSGAWSSSVRWSRRRATRRRAWRRARSRRATCPTCCPSCSARSRNTATSTIRSNAVRLPPLAARLYL